MIAQFSLARTYLSCVVHKQTAQSDKRFGSRLELPSLLAIMVSQPDHYQWCSESNVPTRP